MIHPFRGAGLSNRPLAPFIEMERRVFLLNIIEAISDKNLFGGIFKDLSTWGSWVVALKVIFGLGLEMTEEEVSLYRRCTAREDLPRRPFKEVFLICGRRAGKSFVTALIAVYLALFQDHSEYLAAGERGVVMVIATDKKQAQIILGYIRAFLLLKLLKPFVEADRAESIDLTNRISIEVRPCSLRAVRGYTITTALCEESAFWRDSGVNPDREVFAAIRPAMSTIPSSMLISISTPYSKQGVLFDAYKEHFGKDDGETLVWVAPSILMNPTLSQEKISREIAKDPAAAKSEWGAIFREDLEDFISLEIIEKCIIRGRKALPPAGFSYFAFCDPSGGGADEFTLSVGHREGGKVIQDLLLAMKGDPHGIAAFYAGELKKYGLSMVTGDKYAGAWVSQAFQKEGIKYTASEQNKSEIYLAALPFIHSGQVELLDDEIMTRQFRMLERRRTSSGKDSVDHPSYSGGAACHDDKSNASAGLIAMGCQAEKGVPGLFFAGRGAIGDAKEKTFPVFRDRDASMDKWLRGD